MKRAIVLSLVMLFSVGVMLPFTTDWSEASKAKVAKKRKKIKKYSRAWWRIYRAKQRRARALAARRRALAERRETAAALAQKAAETNSVETAAATNQRGGSTDKRRRGGEKQTPRVTPVLGGETAVAAGGSDLQFRVADVEGRQIGSAELRVVGAAMPTNEEGMPERARKQMIAGVPVSALRRTVIDKMISENGWIVNDFQREVNGRKVFVVVAQTSAGGSVQSRQFYFTEIDGRIYSLSTNAPNDYSEKVAADSERALTTILQRGGNRPAQSAELR
jgi:hypothetical protein